MSGSPRITEWSSADTVCTLYVVLFTVIGTKERAYSRLGGGLGLKAVAGAAPPPSHHAPSCTVPCPAGMRGASGARGAAGSALMLMGLYF